ncbi:MAG: HTH domain-containing protein [Saprospiraceae bacterium]|nr:HTH domain-containing protein [Saprospiraceae bacterium]
MTFLDLAEKVLEEEKTALDTADIWAVAEKKGFTKILNSKGRTPWATLAALLYVNVRDNQNSKFAVTNTRPKKFYLKSIGDIEAILADAQKKQQQKEVLEEKELKKQPLLEKELHQYLAYYAFYYLKCFSKTINHSNSSKKEYGEWVHPDMVGCHFSSEEWEKTVTDLSKATGNPSVKLFSFDSFANTVVPFGANNGIGIRCQTRIRTVVRAIHVNHHGVLMLFGELLHGQA